MVICDYISYTSLSIQIRVGCKLSLTELYYNLFDLFRTSLSSQTKTILYRLQFYIIKNILYNAIMLVYDTYTIYISTCNIL